MHPSGYVREASVVLLDRDASPRALRFLLVRCGDWVPEVCRAAENAVERRLNKPNADELLKCLGLLDRLSSTSRGSVIARRALDSVVQFVTIEALIQALRGREVASRRLAAQLLVENGHTLDALEAALRQADPRTLHVIGEAALSQVTNGERAELLGRLMSARSPYLAELAFWTLLKEEPDSDVLAMDGLRDRRRGMRLLARHHLQRTGFDAPAFYRELLHRDPVPALRGLGDCGAAADAARAAAYLVEADPIVRRTAVEAVARLDAAGYAERLVERLADDDVGVAATAARYLSRVGLPAATTDQLWSMMTSDRRPHVVHACSRAARGLPRWSRSRIALRSIAATDSSLREIGLELVDHVLFTWNRSYVAPAPDEVEELSALLTSTRDSLGESRYEALAFATASYGIGPAG